MLPFSLPVAAVALPVQPDTPPAAAAPDNNNDKPFVASPHPPVTIPALYANCVLGSTYRVPLASLPAPYDQEPWYTALTLVPTVSSVCPQKPKPLNTTFVSDGILHLPRFAGLTQLGVPPRDERSLGEPMSPDAAFTGTLCDTNPPQQAATTAVLQQLAALGGALLVLPCGFGKTVCSLFIAASIHRRTLIVVHAEALAAQWVDRIGAFNPGARVGRIQQDTVDVHGCDFVVCMIQSLIKRSYDPAILASFGLVILDEAHHVAAPMFSQALCKLPARYILGLSATPNRPDGCGEALHWLLGPTAFKAQRVREHVHVRMITYTRGSQEELVSKYSQKPLCATMLTELGSDMTRTRLIQQLILEYCDQARNILVLSDRLDQLAMIEVLLQEARDGLSVARVVGGTKAKDREAGFGAQVILSTYHYASEGIDIPRLDTLVMATPRGTVEQTVGRILRPFPNKPTPVVVDVKDPFSLFEGMAWKRFRYYKSQSYSVTREADVGEAEENSE